MPRFKVLLTDYAWAGLEIERRILADANAELVVAPQADVPTLQQLAREADAIMTCWAQVTSEVIAAAERCRIVSRMGIGLDNIDVAECTRRGIPVTNVPDYCVAEVAEHALALILALARNIAGFHCDTKAGRYKIQAGMPLRRLEGQTLGIVGWGNIGRRLAKKAAALDLRIVVHSRRNEHFAGVVFDSLQGLLQQADFVSLHVPLTPDTRNVINADRLSLMKPTAYLVNTARGGLVDHDALAAALAAGRLAGAGLDVQVPEPPDLSQPPFNDPRVIVTPHSAFVSLESLADLRRRAATQVAVRLQGGRPENVVNGAG